MSSDTERTRAAAAGQPTWGREASVHMKRYAKPAPNRHRRCQCGCGGAATYVGMANGLALTGGCELSVRRWVRDGYTEEVSR